MVSLASDRELVVRINDCGPDTRGRIIDLSRAAARRLDMTAAGVARVRVYAVPEPGHSP